MVGSSLLGHGVLRREDLSLLTGQAMFVDDFNPADLLHISFVRSTVAHALITGIDVNEAQMGEGVVGVYGSEDISILPQQGFPLISESFNRSPLANGVVRYVGEPIAAILAKGLTQAADATDLVSVDYEPLEVLVDPSAALDPGAPVLFPDEGSNRVLKFQTEANPEDMKGHDRIIRCRLINNRMAGVPIEASAIIAEPDGNSGLNIWCTTQSPHGVQAAVASALNIDSQLVRVRAPAVGGGFGAKAVVYPEFLVVAWLAFKMKKSVKWTETRSENLVNMAHGRDQIQDYELGVTNSGKFLWLRAQVTANAGAYPVLGAFLPALTMSMASGPYRIPVVDFSACSVATNTTPTSAFRGAGRPEATAALERVIDLAAVELEIDPAEIRRRNFLQPDEFPYRTPTGALMDTGEYEKSLDLALESSDYLKLREEQQIRRQAGDRQLLGIGISSYVEVTAGGLYKEYGSVEVETDGTVIGRVGTASHGQGHVTAFTQIICEVLGVTQDKVTIIHGDTKEIPRGTGTMASRSLQTAGSALWETANLVLDQGRSMAAEFLEANFDDIVVDQNGLSVVGVPAKVISWAEIATRFAEQDSKQKPRLSAETDFDQGEATYPFGSHVAVVEVDIETGEVRLIRHIAIDDCGRILNPMLVDGQVHGGTAQGVSQALFEEMVYDEEGNPRTTNFTDYAIPGPTELPYFEVFHTETPTNLNPLGAKGIGESGTIGSTPAVQNAVVDALSHLGVRHLDMPATPERVWKAIQKNK